MSTRRAHHKSKLGCSSCKRRRIKCDEGRPSCNNCTKRCLECSFPMFDPKSRSSTSFPGGKALSQIHVFPQAPESLCLSPLLPSLLDVLAPDDLFKDLPDVLQPRFKHILHHFVNFTSATISHNNLDRTAWTMAMPQLTASHQFVLPGIFAVASLHLSRCVGTESERKTYHNIAVSQLNFGLSRYRKSLEHITEDNAEALFAFSTMTTLWILTTAGEEAKAILRSMQSKGVAPSQHREAISGITLVMMSILHCLRGVLVILVPCWHRIQGGLLSPVAKREWWPRPIPTSPQAIEEDRKLQALEKMWMQPGRKYEYYYSALASDLKALRESFALVSQLTVMTGTESDGTSAGRIVDWGAVMTWPIRTSLEFISSLEQRRHEAWVIMAHYAILPSRVKGVWWLESFAPNIIATAALILGEHNWSLIEWPAGVVGVDLDRFRSQP